MPTTSPTILVADDDDDFLRLMSHHLSRWGYRAVCASDKPRLLRALESEHPRLVMMDVRFGEHDGVELLRSMLDQQPGLPVILMTAFGSIESAVTAMRLGARDYITKPIDLNRLRLTIGHALDDATESSAGPEPSGLRSAEPGADPRLSRPILGEGRGMVELRALVGRVASTDATVLILAESGTGKELVARALHELGPRASGPFVAINVASLPRELAETVLFGHERGAFTGADRSRTGCCEAADGGTLFLDEIGEMDPLLQSKLLRFLQERTVQRVGRTDSTPVDVRVVAATHRNLKELVDRGLFRQDLYYRLNVVPITIPPLRERGDDIVLLAESFLKRAATRYNRSLLGFREPAIDAMKSCVWPGNVRQLENLIERSAILSPGPWIELKDLDLDSADTNETGHVVGVNGHACDSQRPSPSRAMDHIERDAIANALRLHAGKVSEAARDLGISQATIYRKIKKFGIEV